MKANSSHHAIWMVLCLLVSQTAAVSQIYSDASDKILRSVKVIIVSFEESISPLTPHFMNEEKMAKNKNFYTTDFLNDMNKSFEKVERKKEEIYEEAKRTLNKVFKLAKMEKSFDLNLPTEDQMMMKFVINMDKEMRTPDMKKLWHKALSAKNGMFSSIQLLQKALVQSSINLVNFFDNMEEFRNEASKEEELREKITLGELKNYQYVTGFLHRMLDMYTSQNEIFKEINQSMLSVNQDILEWSRNFGHLKKYMDDFMAGKIKIEEEVEEEMLEDLEEGKADGEDNGSGSGSGSGSGGENGDGADTETDFVPRDGEDYTPTAGTQKNSERDPTNIVEEAEQQADKEKREKEEIEHLAVTRIKEMETQLNQEEMNKEKSALETDLEDEAETVKTCNKVLLMNYFVDGHIEAEEIPLDEPITACPEIRYSCCTREDTEKMQKDFIDEKLPKYAKKYYLLRKIMRIIMRNYTKFNDLAYDQMKIQGADPVCHTSAETVIFTPIGRHFVNTFLQKLEKAHKWIISAKSGFFCGVCNQRNHHTILEYNQIIFQREFCQSMIDNTFDFVSIFYMNIADFLNSVTNLLQCDKNHGKYSEEIEIERFGMGPRGKEIIKDCIRKEQSFCASYCSEFEFSEMDSFLDVSLPRLTALYDFVMFRMNDYYESEVKSNIDAELFHMVDDHLQTERFEEGYIRLDNPIKVFSSKFNDLNAENPMFYGVDDDTITEAIFSK